MQWYSESIRSKMEIRQQILDEIKNNGQSVYRVEDYQQLQHNTELINKWMKKNPKDAEKFLRFKDGYESRWIHQAKIEKFSLIWIFLLNLYNTFQYEFSNKIK